MDRLWAPWRMQYIKQIDKDDCGCIFCTKPEQTQDRVNLILHRGKSCFIIMNLYPYNNGHLMIVPYMHTSSILDLPDSCAVELWQCIGRAQKALTAAIHPDAFNIGMNLGRIAGAGIDQHIHMHIVPRWNGDTNFMPVIGGTKVISQSVTDTYDALLPYFLSTDGISSGNAP